MTISAMIGNRGDPIS